MYKKKWRIVEKTKQSGQKVYHLQVKRYMWFPFLAEWELQERWSGVHGNHHMGIFYSLEDARKEKKYEEKNHIRMLEQRMENKIVKEKVIE